MAPHISDEQRKALKKKHGAPLYVVDADTNEAYMIIPANLLQQWMVQEVNRGIEQLKNGQFTEFDEKSLKQFFEDIKENGRKRLADNH